MLYTKRANLAAIALAATAGPHLPRSRRYYAPKYVLLAFKELAAIFRALVRRFCVGVLPWRMILSPLMRLSGASRSQETKWSAVGQGLRSYRSQLQQPPS